MTARPLGAMRKVLLGAARVFWIFTSKTEPFEEGRTHYSTGMQGVGETGRGYINAFDLRTLDFAWRDLQIGLNKGWGGVMSTGTGLVAYGDDAQNFVILNG